MKQLKERFYLDYFIVSMILMIGAGARLVQAIMHPRVINIIFVLYFLIPALYIFSRGNKKKYVHPRERRRINKEYNKRREQAEADGIEFTECPSELTEQIQKSKVARNWITVIALMLVVSPGLYVGILITQLCSHSRMPYEYHEIIMHRKYNNSASSDCFKYFPDEIPKGAKRVMVDYFPGFAGPKHSLYLSFDTTPDYVNGVIEQYKDELLEYKYTSQEYVDHVNEYRKIPETMRPLTKYLKKSVSEDEIVVYENAETWTPPFGFYTNPEKTHIVYYFLSSF